MGVTMDARSSEPGLDIPQTRQRFEPALTSAPQPLQANANVATPTRLIFTAGTLRRCDYSAAWFLASREEPAEALVQKGEQSKNGEENGNFDN